MPTSMVHKLSYTRTRACGEPSAWRLRRQSSVPPLASGADDVHGAGPQVEQHAGAVDDPTDRAHVDDEELDAADEHQVRKPCRAA